MKKKELSGKKSHRKTALFQTLIGSALLTALGILLLLRPDFATNTLASVLGWIFIGGGALLIALTLLNRDVMGLGELLLGIAAAAAGIFIVIHPGFLAAAFGRIIGCYVGFHGITTLLTVPRLRSTGRTGIPNLVLGCVLLTIALVLFFVPMSLSNLLFRILGGFMAVSGGVNLVLRSKVFTDPPGNNPNIIDAREDD